MPDLKLRMIDHSYMRVLECAPHVAQELSDRFRFLHPNRFYMPLFKKKNKHGSRIWDGYIRLIDRKTGKIPVGLYPRIKEFCRSRDYSIKIERDPEYGGPGSVNDFNDADYQHYLDSHDFPFTPHDHQKSAFMAGVTLKRCCILSPTASGKSYIIYLLMQWYLENHPDSKAIIVVEGQGLVEQLYSDMAEYGFDMSECQKIYSGHDKEVTKKLTISTYQSIVGLPKKWFKPFGMAFVDEVHGVNVDAKSLVSIMNNMSNANYRIGTTGTLDGTTMNQMQVEACFGPTIRVATTRELQEKELLAPIDIKVISLKHDEKSRRKQKGNKYHEECEYIAQHENRNKFIKNLALDLHGNTILFYNLVEKHGEVLYNLIKDAVPEGRNVYFVAGKVPAQDREYIRKIVDTENDAIIVASLGTFRQGINIVNIRNIIFASPIKKNIRLLQSIGRGLRKTADNALTTVYDIADNLCYEKWMNFCHRHGIIRTEIYKKEEFPFSVVEIDI